MLAAFSAEIDDGSLEQVAGEVMQLYAECADGDYEGVARLRAAAGTTGGSSVALASCRQAEKTASEGSSDDDDDGDDQDDENNGDASNGSTDRLERPIMGARDSMEVDSSSYIAEPVLSSPVVVAAPEVPALSMQDVADGWEMAPSRARRRGHVGS
eukprot:SM000191S05218  [mRNA]  locus=s191:100876:101715:+ [translate_table: standard]